MKKMYILAVVLALVLVLEVVFAVIFCLPLLKPIPEYPEEAKPNVGNPKELTIRAEKKEPTTEETKDPETSAPSKGSEDGLRYHDKNWEERLDQYVTITEKEQNVTSYVITGKSGTVLLSEEIVWRTAEIRQIDTNVLMYFFQAGTGPSTNSAIFFDVENERISESFVYVLHAEGEYVFCGGHEDNDHSITVKNIFDPAKCNKRTELIDCSPRASDVVVDIETVGKGKAVVTYLTGGDFKETKVEITFP